MIYVDDMRMLATVGRLTARWSHMWSDTSTAELLAFASGISLNPKWIQNSRGFIHFDLTESKRELAVRAGAVEVAYGEFKGWRLCRGHWRLIDSVCYPIDQCAT